MPVKSEAQRRYLNWKFGHEWMREHHFAQKGKLPERTINRAISAKKKRVRSR